MSIAVLIEQRDDKLIAVGPITSTAGGFYDAAGHTCALIIKADRYAADTTPIAGTLTGNTTVGFTASFSVPASATAVAGVMWVHAYIVSAANKRSTILARPLHITPT